MAPLPSVAQVVKVLIKGTIQGQQWANVHYLQYTGAAPTVADLNTVGAAIAAAWNTNIAPLCGSGVILTGIDLADLTSAFASTSSVTVSNAGTRAGTALVNSAAMVASWKINMRYRGGHPRSYIPAGMLADTTSGRLWATAFVTAANSALAAYRTALNAITASGTTYKMVCVRYHINKVLQATPVVVTINSATVHGRIDTQRHRLGKETP